MAGGDELADYYGRRAAEYERIYARPERQEDLAALRERVAGLCRGRRVLELACGTGYWTDLIAGCAAGVTALDVGEEVLALARAKPNARKVEFVRGSAYEIPDFARRHDLLFAGFWWSHVPLRSLDGFLSGAVSAIAPGGTLAFIDNRYVEGSSTPVSRRDADGNTWQQRTLADRSSQEVLKNFPREDELLAHAARHGAGARVEWLPFYWLLTWQAPN